MEEARAPAASIIGSDEFGWWLATRGTLILGIYQQPHRGKKGNLVFVPL